MLYGREGGSKTDLATKSQNRGNGQGLMGIGPWKHPAAIVRMRPSGESVSDPFSILRSSFFVLLSFSGCVAALCRVGLAPTGFPTERLQRSVSSHVILLS